MLVTELNNAAIKTTYASSLKGYWRFEDNGGTTVTDSSGNSMTGTASRANINGAAKGVFGFRGDFVSASSDKVTITDNSILKPTGNFTIGMWLKTPTSQTGYIFQSYSENTNVAGIRVSLNVNRIDIKSGKNTGVGIGTDVQQATGTTLLNDGVWHHVAATYDGAYLRVFVDGKLDGSVAWANAAAYAATNYVRIGCANNSGSDIVHYDGSLDDLFLLNGTALTTDEINQLYGGAKSLASTTLASDANLQGYWKLDNALTDSSANGYTLTDNSSTNDGGGMFGQARAFSGTTQYAYAAAANNNTTGSQTWSAWIKPTDLAGNYTFLSKDKITARGKQFFVNATTGIISSTLFGLATGGSLNSTNAVRASVWNHVVCMYDATNNLHKIYVNGILTQTATTGTPNSSTANTGIGCDFTGGSDAATNFFKGSIDDVAMFNRALTDTEIQTLFYGRAITSSEFTNSSLYSDANLVEYYKLEDLTGKNGYTLTNSNSTDDASGKFSHGRGFLRASTQYAYVNNAAFRLAAGQSYGGWFKFTAVNVDQRFVGVSDAATTNYTDLILGGATGKVSFEVNGLSAGVTSPITLSTGTWYHIIGVCTGSSNVIYINGIATIVAVTGSHTAGTGDFAIGRMGAYANDYFGGTADDVVFFNRALAPYEVMEIYNAQLSNNSGFFMFF